MTLALSPLEAAWRTKQKDPHTKLMFIWGEGHGGYTWPWSSNEHNRRETNWDLKPLLLQPLFSYNLSISYSLSIEQRGSFGCLDFCKCFTHLFVVYHLDRMLHREFFPLPKASRGKWLLFASYDTWTFSLFSSLF